MMKSSIHPRMGRGLWLVVLAAPAILFSVPRPGNSAGLTVHADALNNNAGAAKVVIDQSCVIGEPGTPCASDVLRVIAGPADFNSTVGYGAVSSDLAAAQIRAHAASGGGNGGVSDYSGALPSGYFRDNVTFSLAPGATWPQAFTVRLVVEGRFSKTFLGNGGGTYYHGAFRSDVLVDPGLVVGTTFMSSSTSFPAVHEKVVTLNGPTSFSVDASLSLNATTERPVVVDFSTRTLDGLRFEVVLPPELVMTSQSGVFLTDPPADEPVIIPDPCPGDFCFVFPPCDSMECFFPTSAAFDPPIVRGYEYEIPSGSFLSLELPTDIGDGQYDLQIFDDEQGSFGLAQPLAGGTPFYFIPGRVDRFRVLGIEAEAGLDPTDPQAFVTMLAFGGPYGSLVMTPLMFACANGIDDDADGLTDVDDGDPGCEDVDDDSERGSLACDNGIDDDGDGTADFPADPDCASPFGSTEVPEPGLGSMLSGGISLLLLMRRSGRLQRPSRSRGASPT